ncbi:Carboxyl-terminal protease [Frigoriglobus tundricola]|uniref:Carboxyl-terminal protease n=2 Tax=Frigoriglobus tundricola TaxID=2774151 RepID=A0A6M5YKI0_9BACT|nr:Carboxyl-terminal protease [Frigoriglobus tundricola]
MNMRTWILGAVAVIATAVGPIRAGAAEPGAENGKPHGPYAVIVGVGEFKDAAIQPRPTADADAKALHTLLTDPKYLGIAADRAKLLLSGDATREAVVKAVDAAVAGTGPDDLLIVAFFGRGTSAADKPCFFTADSTVKERAKTTLQVSDLEPAFKKVKRQNVLFLMDVQYKGGVDAGKEKIVDPNVGDYVKLLFGDKDEETAAAPPNRLLVFGNPPFQDTLTKGDHGLFYSVLADALTGKADQPPFNEGYEPDGLVSAKELSAYLEKEIPNGARAIGKTDKEKELTPIVGGAVTSKFWVTHNPAETEKVKARIDAIAALVKGGKLAADLAKEADGLLFRMPKLKWQQELRKGYQKLADGGPVADLERARKELIAGLKLPAADAESYVKQVLPAVYELNAKYIRPITRGELAANGLRGLFLEADEPVPADIADAIKAPKELTEDRIKELLTEARTRLGKREDLDGDKAADVTVRAVFHGLNDPHSLYFDREEWISFSKQLEGRFPGVGIIIRRDAVRDGLLVVTPIKGSPAFRAGIYAGDLITEVRLEVDKTGAPLPSDAKKVYSTKGMKTDDAVKLITGRPETPVTLIVEREGEKEPRAFRILRNYVMVETVHGVARKDNMEWSYYLDPDLKIGYIQIESFLFTQGDLGTYPDLKKALAQMKRPGLNGLVIDVRNNPGGSLQAVVEMCTLFVGKEDIVTIKGRSPSENYTYRGEFDGDKSYPIVVLINGNSASASEILSACLQDHGRATVMGERSYGKGSVQRVRPYNYTQGQMKYTDARYYPPLGRNIDKIAAEQDPSLKQRDEWGVKPDTGFEIKLTREERADWLEYSRDLANIPPPGKKHPVVDPSKDKQLQKAIDHLKGLIKERK